MGENINSNTIKIQGRINELMRALEEVTERATENCNLHSVMPSLHLFKERRDKLKLTLRQVAEKTNVSAATISRIEREEGLCSYHNVALLDEFYCCNGA